MRGDSGSIEWICNHSRSTQLALLKGYVDSALIYEREQEEIAVSEG
jgi:tungstate transport system substrate-binding protein